MSSPWNTKAVRDARTNRLVLNDTFFVPRAVSSSLRVSSSILTTAPAMPAPEGGLAAGAALGFADAALVILFFVIVPSPPMPH